MCGGCEWYRSPGGSLSSDEHFHVVEIAGGEPESAKLQTGVCLEVRGSRHRLGQCRGTALGHPCSTVQHSARGLSPLAIWSRDQAVLCSFWHPEPSRALVGNYSSSSIPFLWRRCLSPSIRMCCYQLSNSELSLGAKGTVCILGLTLCFRDLPVLVTGVKLCWSRYCSEWLYLIVFLYSAILPISAALLVAV